MPNFNMTKIYNLGQTLLYMKQEYYDGLKNIPAIKFVGVCFESTNYKVGQDELNESISQGYRIVGEYPTSSGVVFSLTRKMKTLEKTDQENFGIYCSKRTHADSLNGGLQ